MALSDYIKQVQLLLGDLSETNYNRFDLIDYINEGRSQLAAESGCVRLVPSNNNTVTGQELYPFSGVALSTPGASSIIAIRGITIVWNTFRYTVSRVSFSKYQALVRTYANNFTDVPRVGTQFGQGVNGSVYLYPIPNAVYPMEWDCSCDVSPLATDADVELIPVPWNISIQYYAAYKALESAQNFQAADRMFTRYELFMKRARAFSQPGMVTNWYGRG